MNTNQPKTHQDIIDLTDDCEKIIKEKWLIEEDQQCIKEEQELFEEEQQLIQEKQRHREEEQQFIKAEQQHIKEDQRCIKEEQWCIKENHQCIKEDHWCIDKEQQLEVACQQQIAEEEQQHHIGAHHGLIVPEEDEVRMENESRVHVRVSGKSNYCCIAYILYSMWKTSVVCHCQMLYSAGSTYHWGDHHTPCWECQHNDPDECFWILNSGTLNVLGHQVRNGRHLQNKQVQFFLYESFIDEEYNYLQDRRVNEEENIFEFCGGLPHFLSPSVLSGTSNKAFPTKMEPLLLVSIETQTGKVGTEEAITLKPFDYK